MSNAQDSLSPSDAARSRRRAGRIAALGALLSMLATPAAGDLQAGRERFVDRCGRCHGMIEERTAQAPGGFLLEVVTLPLGPNLSGIYGQPAGRVAGYRYSDAFRSKATALIWDAATLDRWLADSQAMIPGSYMLVRIDASERADIISYLERYARPR